MKLEVVGRVVDVLRAICRDVSCPLLCVFEMCLQVLFFPMEFRMGTKYSFNMFVSFGRVLWVGLPHGVG